MRENVANCRSKSSDWDIEIGCSKVVVHGVLSGRAAGVIRGDTYVA